MAWIAAALASAAVAALLGATLCGKLPPLWRRTWLRRRSGRRVVVHTSDGASLEGVLMVTATDGLVLAWTRHLDAELDLSDQVWVPRERIAFIQVPW